MPSEQAGIAPVLRGPLPGRPTAAASLAAGLVVLLLVWASPASGQTGGDRDAQVEDRLGLLEKPWRIWKLPLRYTASRSPYFQPGAPPYRQQPENAGNQSPPDDGMETEMGPVSPVRPPGGGSDSSSDSSDAGSSDSDGVSSNDGGGSTPTPGDAPSDDPDPGFGPTPTPGDA